MNRNTLIILYLLPVLIVLVLLTVLFASHKANTSKTETTSSSLLAISMKPENNATNVSTNTPIEITFNRPTNSEELIILLDPPFDYRSHFNNKTLTITPSSALSNGTTYMVIIKFGSQDVFDGSYQFTTAGTSTITQPPYPPPGFFELRDDQLRTTRTDIFLKNNTPFSNAFFSIESSFKEQPEGHFAFNVTLEINNQSKQEFINWLHSLKLTDTQINSLDITYQ